MEQKATGTVATAPCNTDISNTNIISVETDNLNRTLRDAVTTFLNEDSENCQLHNLDDPVSLHPELTAESNGNVSEKGELAECNIINLYVLKDEARVDSCTLAKLLQIQHKNVLALIKDYRTDFENFGRVAFQTRPLETNGGTQNQRIALLNEDQTYLLLTFSRNTTYVRNLKVKLIEAFARFRKYQQVETDYLPFYHELHEGVKVLADHAWQNGSTTEESKFHININRLINSAFGLESGQRPNLPGNLRAKVTAANVLAKELIEEAIEEGYDHKEVYQHVKQGILAFANSGRKRLKTQMLRGG
jgi:phage regulator Rha-like protein